MKQREHRYRGGGALFSKVVKNIQKRQNPGEGWEHLPALATGLVAGFKNFVTAK